MSEGVKNLFMSICLIVLAAALFGAIVTAGAVENDVISIGEGARRGIILIVVMAVCVFGLIKLEREDE